MDLRYHHNQKSCSSTISRGAVRSIRIKGRDQTTDQSPHTDLRYRYLDYHYDHHNFYFAVFSADFPFADPHRTSSSVVTARWKYLDFQQETSDFSQSSRYCQIHKFSKILNVRRLTLSMIQNLLILQMFNDQVLEMFFSVIPLKIHQDGHKNVPHPGFQLHV